MVQENPNTCRRCDLREPIPTMEDRIRKCKEIEKRLIRKMRGPRPKQLKLFNEDLPF
jgi:hypothetical protein